MRRCKNVLAILLCIFMVLQAVPMSKVHADDLDETTVTEETVTESDVSSENEEATQEVGSITKNAGDMTDEDVIFAKAEEVAKTKGISINKALREVSK